MTAINLMNSYTTFSGYTLADAVGKMQAELPAKAYKNVPGSFGLTDINPAFLTEIATEVFGICGVGWAYNFDVANIVVTEARYERRNQEPRTVFRANLSFLELRFQYRDEENKAYWSHPVIGTGFSENDNIGYAVRGALTNAIGAAFSKLCWQLSVYKGEFTMPEPEKKGITKAKPAPTKAQPKKAEPSSAPEQSLPAIQATEEEPVEEPQDGKTLEEHNIEWAKTVIITKELNEKYGVPYVGMTLGDISSKEMGKAVLGFLSGEETNRSGIKFVPETPDQTSVKYAASLLLKNLSK